MSNAYENLYRLALDELSSLRKLYEEKCKELEKLQASQWSMRPQQALGSDVGDSEVNK